MKRGFIAALVFVALTHSNAQQQPFIVTAFGGLFFPSSPDFKDTYKSSSDLIYGFGACLPIQHSMFIFADYSFFKPEALLNGANDSSLSLDERILHIGMLSKQPLTSTLSIRLFGGINRITIKQATSS